MKPGATTEPVGVDLLGGGTVDVADGHHPPVPDADVGAAGRPARAVDDVTTPDDHVEHRHPPFRPKKL